MRWPLPKSANTEDKTQRDLNQRSWPCRFATMERIRLGSATTSCTLPTVLAFFKRILTIIVDTTGQRLTIQIWLHADTFGLYLKGARTSSSQVQNRRRPSGGTTDEYRL